MGLSSVLEYKRLSMLHLGWGAGIDAINLYPKFSASDLVATVSRKCLHHATSAPDTPLLVNSRSPRMSADHASFLDIF